MKKIFILILSTFLLVACGNEASQQSNEKTEMTDKEIETKNYYTFDEDLSMIASILGEHEIIALGEALHSSLDVSNLKTELIKELVETHGFNKLYIESSKAEIAYFNSNDDKELIPDDILPIELLGESFLSLFDIENLTVVGIDYGPYVTPTLTGNYILDLITEEIGKLDKEQANDLKSFEMQLMRWKIGQSDDGPLTVKDNIYEDIMNHSKYDSLDESTKKFIETRNEELNDYYTKTSMATDTRNAYEMRDAYMAKNIKEDMKNDDKSIVLTHNDHAMADIGSYESEDEVMRSFFTPPYKTITNHLRDDGYDVYVVGLFVNEGKYYPASRGQQEFILEHKDDETTLEGFLGKEVDQSIFIDYKISDFIPETVTGAYDHGVVKYRADMKKNQDGIIYIPTIEE